MGKKASIILFNAPNTMLMTNGNLSSKKECHLVKLTYVKDVALVTLLGELKEDLILVNRFFVMSHASRTTSFGRDSNSGLRVGDLNARLLGFSGIESMPTKADPSSFIDSHPFKIKS